MALTDSQSSIKFQGLTFKFYGCLTYQSERFDPDFWKHMPKRNKNGSLSVRQSRDTRPAAYWKAQCAFRGLPTKGLSKTTEFQDLLNGKESLGQAKELSEFEKVAQEKQDAYWKQEEEKEQAAAIKEDERLQKEAMETLKSRFLGDRGQGVSEAILVKNYASQWRFRKAADILELPYVSVHGKMDFSDMTCDTNNWIIFGGKNGEALKKKQEIEDGYKNAEEEKDRKKKKLIEDGKNLLKAIRDDMVKFSRENGGAWDVAGKWKICCPYVDEWNGISNSLKLEIFVTPSKNGGKDMWAKFDFGMFSGMFRFLKPGNSAGKAQDEARPGDKRKRDAYDDNENYSKYDYDSDENTEIPDPAFNIPSDCHPSSKCPTWQYRKRARETNGDGDPGYIMTEEDKIISEIKFGGLAGETLSGTIESELCPKTSFTGIKYGKSSLPPLAVWKEWKRLSDRAAESEYRRW